MALERIGLGGVLKFDPSNAVQGMQKAHHSARQLRDAQGRFIAVNARVGGSFGRLTSTIRTFGSRLGAVAGKMGAALQGLGSALTLAGGASLPLTAALGFGIKQAADFEQQMSAVSAVANASAEDMDRLTLKAKNMGATTVFSATQSAQAMEELSRAGFTVNETIDGLSGVMDLAAADSIDLASAARITSLVIRGMGLESNQAARVADVLTRTSQKTATDVTLLGEGMKFAASQAKTMGIELPEVATALGAISDAGIRGTLAGTSLTNALVKLAKPSKAATGFMKKFGIELAKNADGSLNLFDTMRNVSKGLEGITDLTQKASIVSEIFGIRGQKAFSAIETALKSGKIDTLLKELNVQFNAGGAAAEAAEKRLDNFKGQITLLKSALEGFAIETAGLFLKGGAAGIKTFTKGLGQVVEVLQLLNGNVSESDERFKKFGPTVIAIAKGIKEGFDTVIGAVNTVRTVFVNVIKQITGRSSPEFIKSITKWITIIGVVVAAIAPVALAIGGVIITVVALAGFIKPLLIVIVALFGLVAQAITVATSLILLFGKKGESAGQVIVRIFRLVQKAFQFVINLIKSMIKEIKERLVPAFREFARKAVKFVDTVRENFQKMFSAIIQAGKRLVPIFKLIFRTLGIVIGKFGAGVLKVFGAILTFMRPILNAMRKIATFLIEGIINQFIRFVSLIVKAADLVGRGDLIPAELREFIKGGEFKIDQNVSIDQAAGLEGEGNAFDFDFDKLFDLSTDNAKDSMDALALQKKLAAGPKQTEVNLDLTDKRKLDIQNCMNVDGREMSVAQARHKQEVNERAGFKTTPWQRRVIVEQGAAPVGGLGGQP